jgi:hypothetical protein
MLARIERGDFYILCPDNDVPRAVDEKRMAWAMGDVIENRPALSRWHPTGRTPSRRLSSHDDLHRHLPPADTQAGRRRRGRTGRCPSSGPDGVDVVTFGCRLNAYESEAIRARASADGLTDAVVFNTCAVTNEAVRQARQAIRKARRERPDARLIVTGCAAQIDPAAFAAMPEVDLVLGNAEKAAPAPCSTPPPGCASTTSCRSRRPPVT